MAQSDVHYHLTKAWALEVIGNRLGAAGTYAAELIASGNRFADACSVFNLVFYPFLHFADWLTARYFAERAIGSGHPYIFGVTLHQIQDWFSHQGEGYRFLDGMAHYRHFIKYRLRNTRQMADFFIRRPRPLVESTLSALYPGVCYSQFTDSELIDLYLRESRLAAWEERERYGYFSDRYYGHTNRDQAMKRWTQHLIHRFVERVRSEEMVWRRICRCEYRPDMVSLIIFFAMTLVRLLV